MFVQRRPRGGVAIVERRSSSRGTVNEGGQRCGPGCRLVHDGVAVPPPSPPYLPTWPPPTTAPTPTQPHPHQPHHLPPPLPTFPNRTHRRSTIQASQPLGATSLSWVSRRHERNGLRHVSSGGHGVSGLRHGSSGGHGGGHHKMASHPGTRGGALDMGRCKDVPLFCSIRNVLHVIASMVPQWFCATSQAAAADSRCRRTRSCRSF